MSTKGRTYASRSANFVNPVGKRILETIERKKSNLCVSVDVTRSSDVIRIVEAVAPFVCMVKTHIDIVEDFTEELSRSLVSLSEKYDFIIFEDRKFADIGNTVTLQYSSGVHKIASWAHLTNAHAVPGPGVIDGLASVGLPLERGLLLLAEMSSAGTLARGEYSREAIRMARARRDFAIGFIAMKRFEADEEAPPDEDWLILTPGVGLDVKGDSMGQQYKTPRQVVLENDSDIIIVGRGIYGKGHGFADDVIAKQADRYRAEGWSAYQERLQSV